MGEGIKLFFSSLPGGSGFFDDHVNWPDRDAFIEEHYESETDDGQPRLVTSDGGVVQNVAPRNLEALHRRLRQTVLIRTHKDDLVGLPGKRFERIDVPLTDGADRDWFDAKARSALVVSRALRRAQREHNLERARQLEQKLRQLRSAITQHATRCKRQAVLDYLLALPPEHKVVVIGFHRDLLLDQLAAALRERGRRLVEHHGDNSGQTAATVKAFQTRPEIQFFIGCTGETAPTSSSTAKKEARPGTGPLPWRTDRTRDFARAVPTGAAARGRGTSKRKRID